jgi:FKBP-type peptidyl-prolyl cis-trans isomerase
MRVGGVRILVIPPALAYGNRGAPPVVKKNETLVFAVKLLKLKA